MQRDSHVIEAYSYEIFDDASATGKCVGESEVWRGAFGRLRHHVSSYDSNWLRMPSQSACDSETSDIQLQNHSCFHKTDILQVAVLLIVAVCRVV